MPQAKYLVRHDNGRIFAFTPELAVRADMIQAMDLEEASLLSDRRTGRTSTAAVNPTLPPPGDTPPATPAQTGKAANATQDKGEGEGDDEVFDLNEATKAQMLEFAQANYGLELNKRDTAEQLRAQIIEHAKATDAERNSFDIDAADADTLEAFALKHYGVDIDKRHSIDDLRTEVKALRAAHEAE